MKSKTKSQNTNEKIRLFVGIPILKSYEETFDQLRQNNTHFDNIRWIANKNLHLTLFFIGSVNKQEVNPINKVLSQISSETKTFSLQFNSYKLAPEKKARMIWATFSMNDSFKEISQRITKELAYLRKPDHLPLPHITLARSKKYISNLNFQPAETLPHLPVNQMVLWQSLTHASGAEYIPLQSFPLSEE